MLEVLRADGIKSGAWEVTARSGEAGLGQLKQDLLQDLQKLKSAEGYLNAGYPRYHTLFGRDSLISAWEMLRIDASIARVTLQTLASYQGKAVNLRSEEEPGKILHEFEYVPYGRPEEEPPRWAFPYYGSVDSTPLFIILAGEYFKETGHTALLAQVWSNILAAYGWITHYGDKDRDGYVEYDAESPYGLVHQGWKDGVEDHLGIKPPVAIVEVQGYVYAAYQALIFLGNELGASSISVEAASRAAVLKHKFNQDFWMEDENSFCLALDGEKRPRAVVTSNPGHLLFTGIVAQDKNRPLVSRLFKDDLWTRYGLRNHSVKAAGFDPYSYHKGSIWPHDNWIIYRGLRTLGFDDHASEIKRALLRAYRVLGKIPELYGVVDDEIVDLNEMAGVWANALQAWSVAGLLDMIWDE